MEHEVDSDTNCNWSTVPKSLKERLGEFEITGEIETITNYSIVEIDQNTEKGPADPRRLAVTETPVKDHQLTLC